MKKGDEISGIAMAGEAVHLLRAAPLHALMAYCVGSVPFVLAFLYFWAEMSDGAFAATRCFGLSFLLTVLFVWMKCWQSVFAAGLRSVLTGGGVVRFAWRDVARLIVRQGALQPYGLFLIPGAMLIMVPFYSVHAFFQNMTVLDDGTDSDTRHLMRRAWQQALLWPKQNHVALWLVSPWILFSLVATGGLICWMTDAVGSLVPTEGGHAMMLGMMLLAGLSLIPLCPFGCVVALNIGVALVLVPMMADRLFGLSSAFVRGGTGAYMNSTFLMVVLGLTYLCLDPIMKAVHVLRCFHGEAIRSGADLHAGLRALQEGGKR